MLEGERGAARLVDDERLVDTGVEGPSASEEGRLMEEPEAPRGRTSGVGAGRLMGMGVMTGEGVGPPMICTAGRGFIGGAAAAAAAAAEALRVAAASAAGVCTALAVAG